MQEAAEGDALFECVKCSAAQQAASDELFVRHSWTPLLRLLGAPCHCRQDAQAGRGDEQRREEMQQIHAEDMDGEI